MLANTNTNMYMVQIQIQTTCDTNIANGTNKNTQIYTNTNAATNST